MGVKASIRTMMYYCIKQISTGYLFPQHLGRGSTWSEFYGGNIPRLFKRESNAKRCLAYWLQGTHETKRYYDHNDEYSEEIIITPVPERVKEDYVVVKIILSEYFTL